MSTFVISIKCTCHSGLHRLGLTSLRRGLASVSSKSSSADSQSLQTEKKSQAPSSLFFSPSLLTSWCDMSGDELRCSAGLCACVCANESPHSQCAFALLHQQLIHIFSGHLTWELFFLLKPQKFSQQCDLNKRYKRSHGFMLDIKTHQMRRFLLDVKTIVGLT